MLQEELIENAEFITKVIASDDFSESIKPAFLQDAVRDYPLRGGKRLRSALVRWSCGLLGGDVESAKFAAAAVEVYHNWTLVHDDIIDCDEIRRNSPSTHIKLANFAKSTYNLDGDQSAKFGQDFAILAGDLQQAWAVNLLNKTVTLGVSSECVNYLVNELQNSVGCKLISGEALDVEFSYKKWCDISSKDVEEMLMMKTAVLLEFCAKSGAIIALGAEFANETQVSNIAKFAINAGVAFQLRDDWLGVFSDEKTIGKPILSDLSEGKPTILFLDTLHSLDDESKRVFQTYIGKSSYSDREIKEIQLLIKKSGAEERLLEKSEQLLNDAKKSLAIFPDSKYKTLLAEFADFMINREL